MPKPAPAQEPSPLPDRLAAHLSAFRNSIITGTPQARMLVVDIKDIEEIIEALKIVRFPPRVPATIEKLGRTFIEAVDDTLSPWAEVIRVAIANMNPKDWATLLSTFRGSF